MKKIRVRYPIPSKTFLKKRLIETAKDSNKSIKERIHFYVQNRLDDVEKENIKIIKSKMIIEKANRCIEIAKEIESEVRE
jgi:hypothetical protein